MGLLGNGAVAIWHDIAPEGRAEFYAWHGTEHMPERVGIPGFRRGRRYSAIDADLEFFNLYEADSPAVLTGTRYQARLNNPTPWTTETVKHFRGVVRSICRVEATVGRGQGGLAATWRYNVAPEQAGGHLRTLVDLVMPQIAASDGIAGCHLLVTDADASAIDTAERKLRGEANRLPGWILIAEGWGDEDAFRQFCRSTPSDDVLKSTGAEEDIDTGIYRLQAITTPDD